MQVNQLLQLCTACAVFSIMVTVGLYTVMPEVCPWLTNEKQRKTYQSTLAGREIKLFFGKEAVDGY